MLLFVSCKQDLPKETYIVKVGESILSEEALAAILPPYSNKDSASIAHQNIQEWVSRELLYLAAVEKGLAKDLSMEIQVETFRKSLYGSAFLDIYLSNAVSVTAAELREHYTKSRDRYRRRKEEVKLLHFLLDDNAEANDVKSNLLQYNGDARQSLIISHNVSVKTVSPGDLLPELDKEVFGSPPGRGVLGPIRSDHGYHVLEVLERYPIGSYRGLDEVYDDVSQSIYREKMADVYTQLMDSLLTVYPVETSSGLFIDWGVR